MLLLNPFTNDTPLWEGNFFNVHKNSDQTYWIEFDESVLYGEEGGSIVVKDNIATRYEAYEIAKEENTKFCLSLKWFDFLSNWVPNNAN